VDIFEIALIVMAVLMVVGVRAGSGVGKHPGRPVRLHRESGDYAEDHEAMMMSSM